MDEQSTYDKKNNGIAESTEEMKTALSDYYNYQATLAVESGELTTEQAQDIANKIDTIYSSMSEEQLKKFGKDQKAMDAMYASMVQFEQDLANGASDNLVDGAKAYQNAIQGLTDEAKKGLASVYTIYEEYLNLINKLTQAGQDALSGLDLSSAAYENIRKAYITNWKRNNVQKEGESDEDYAKRQNNAFTSYMQNAMTQAGRKGGTKADAILSLINGDIDNNTRNAIISATTKTNQQAIEDYVKKTNSVSNLRSSMSKAQNNELSVDEYRQLAEEFPEIFSDVAKVQQFMNGTLDLTKEQEKVNNQLIEDLQLQQDITESEIARLEAKGNLLTEDEKKQLENYKMQKNLIDIQLDQAKYAVLYNTEL